jgi:DNA-binding NarL/FixJ family response regulator
MKSHSSWSHGNPPTLGGAETAFPGVLEISKPYNGNLTARKRFEQLTVREKEVLHFVAEGRLNKQVASELCVSIKTIEKHRERLSKKLGIRGIAGLTHFAIYTGIIPCNPQLSMA